MKPERKEITRTIRAWESVIPFFPTDELAIELITSCVESMISTQEQLKWLTSAAVNSMRKWEGIPELRGLFCTRFAPADGITLDCSMPGFTPSELESKARQREMRENEQRLAEYRRAALAAAPEDRAPFLLPPAKSMPSGPIARRKQPTQES